MTIKDGLPEHLQMRWASTRGRGRTTNMLRTAVGYRS
jgi:hypothetical protein